MGATTRRTFCACAAAAAATTCRRTRARRAATPQPRSGRTTGARRPCAARPPALGGCGTSRPCPGGSRTASALERSPWQRRQQLPKLTLPVHPNWTYKKPNRDCKREVTRVGGAECTLGQWRPSFQGLSVEASLSNPFPSRPFLTRLEALLNKARMPYAPQSHVARVQGGLGGGSCSTKAHTKAHKRRSIGIAASQGKKHTRKKADTQQALRRRSKGRRGKQVCVQWFVYEAGPTAAEAAMPLPPSTWPTMALKISFLPVWWAATEVRTAC